MIASYLTLDWLCTTHVTFAGRCASLARRALCERLDPLSDETSEEVDIVVRAKARDPSAIETLYDRYARELYHVAYHLMGSQADAEDVVHDVFVGLPDSLRTYRQLGTLSGWLKRVTSRVALMKLRRGRIAREVTFGKWEDVLPSRRQSTPVERMSLQDAISSLPPLLRSVFVLKEIQGFSHEEISELLDIKVGTSKARLSRARGRLRLQLRDSL